MRHVLSAVVQNVPGVLAHISGMLASRGYNIDSLAVGETEDPHLSRMTFVVVGDDRVLEQIRKQLEKIVTVVKVVDVSAQDYVERDLMLLKVKAAPGGTWPGRLSGDPPHQTATSNGSFGPHWCLHSQSIGARTGCLPKWPKPLNRSKRPPQLSASSLPLRL